MNYTSLTFVFGQFGHSLVCSYRHATFYCMYIIVGLHASYLLALVKGEEMVM